MKALLALLALIHTLHSTQISQRVQISGVLLNQEGRPVSGAQISMKDAALSATTSSDGAFLLDGSVVSLLDHRVESGAAIHLNQLTLNIDQPKRVALRFYTLSGRLAVEMETALLPIGKQVVDLPVSNLATGVYILQVATGGRSESFRYLKNSTSQPRAAVATYSSLLPTTSFIDTLVIDASGHELKKVEIRSSEKSDLVIDIIDSSLVHHPTQFTLKQIVSSHYERNRLRQAQLKFDHQLTGWYLYKDSSITLDLEILEPSKDGVMPQLVVGTRVKDSDISVITLKSGEQTIPASSHNGGFIYLRYVSSQSDPVGRVLVNLDIERGVQRAPRFIRDYTTAEQFSFMFDSYTTPDLLFNSDHVAVVVSRGVARDYSFREYRGKPQDLSSWLAGIDLIVDAQQRISGLDPLDSNPLHHPLADGHRHLLVEADRLYMFATDWATGYNGSNSGAMLRLLTLDQIENNPWGVAHEIGHQHQQPAWMPRPDLVETTVNIYATALLRERNGLQWSRWREAVWDKLHRDWFTLADNERDYWSGAIGSIEQNVNEGRLLLFEQLYRIFGDEIFHLLHRITREEEVDGGTTAERRAYWVRKVIEISGYDLRDYFYRWGVFLSDFEQSRVDEIVKRRALPTPPMSDSLHLITPFSRIDILPLPLIGVRESTPDRQPDYPLLSIDRYCDYSTKSGDFVDPRDGKIYPYKRYGDYDWFMVNLNWDGYDGENVSTKNSVGVYSSNDPDGEVYGRFYPTNPGTSYLTWCPPGWSVPTQSDWNRLYNSISTEYEVAISDLGSCMRCGGDRTYDSDGLWAIGAGTQSSLSAAVGFNALPAGIYNGDSREYDSGESDGYVAAFVEPASPWWHQVLTSGSNSWSRPNKNSRHFSNVRCIRVAAD